MIPNKIYVTEEGKIVTKIPKGDTKFVTYVSYPFLDGLMDNIKVLCGDSVNRYIDTQLDEMKSLEYDIS